MISSLQIKELVYQLCLPEEGGNKGSMRKSYERNKAA